MPASGLMGLPNDVTRLVVGLADGQGLCALERCCKALRELIDDACWQQAFLRSHRPSVLRNPACWKEEYAQRTMWARHWREFTGCAGTPVASRLAHGQLGLDDQKANEAALQLQSLQGNAAPPRSGIACATPPVSRRQLVVDARPGVCGCFASIRAALASAGPGDMVLVRAGVYHERLRLDDVDLVGDGPPGSVVLVGVDGPAIEVSRGASRVANLCVRHESQHAGAAMGGAVLALAGATLVVEGCEVGSAAGHCVIAQGAHVHLVHNHIGRARGVGVLLCEAACGVVEDNDVSHNERAGIAILSGADPLVCRNKIHNGLDSGVMVSTRGRGTIEDNDICANCRAGVAILAEGQPTVRANRIYDGRDSGVLVCEHGLGSIVDNQIYANAMAGLAIGKGGGSRVTGNTIRDGRGGSLCLSLESRSVIVANIIAHSAMHVPERLLPRLQEQNLLVKRGGSRRVAPPLNAILQIQRQRREARPRCRNYNRAPHAAASSLNRPAVAKARLSLRGLLPGSASQLFVWEGG